MPNEGGNTENIPILHRPETPARFPGTDPHPPGLHIDMPNERGNTNSFPILHRPGTPAHIPGSDPHPPGLHIDMPNERGNMGRDPILQRPDVHPAFSEPDLHPRGFHGDHPSERGHAGSFPRLHGPNIHSTGSIQDITGGHTDIKHSPGARQPGFKPITHLSESLVPSLHTDIQEVSLQDNKVSASLFPAVTHPVHGDIKSSIHGIHSIEHTFPDVHVDKSDVHSDKSLVSSVKTMANRYADRSKHRSLHDSKKHHTKFLEPKTHKKHSIDKGYPRRSPGFIKRHHGIAADHGHIPGVVKLKPGAHIDFAEHDGNIHGEPAFHKKGGSFIPLDHATHESFGSHIKKPKAFLPVPKKSTGIKVKKPKNGRRLKKYRRRWDRRRGRWGLGRRKHAKKPITVLKPDHKPIKKPIKIIKKPTKPKPTQKVKTEPNRLTIIHIPNRRPSPLDALRNAARRGIGAILGGLLRGTLGR